MLDFWAVRDYPGYGDALFDEMFLLNNVQLFEEGMVSAEAPATAYVAQLGDSQATRHCALDSGRHRVPAHLSRRIGA